MKRGNLPSTSAPPKPPTKTVEIRVEPHVETNNFETGYVPLEDVVEVVETEESDHEGGPDVS
jgi:hypothetical protein